VVIAERPAIGDDPQGQFDQVLWTWLARARMALMQLDAAHKAVNSPTVLPRDAVDFSVGPDAIIQTDNPQAVRKVSLELPQSAFAITQLGREIRNGSRYPEARSGSISASVVTGRGVEELMGGFSTQIARRRRSSARCSARSRRLAFEMDVKLWPNRGSGFRATRPASRSTRTTRPKNDIGDNLSCDVTYGYAAGLSPESGGRYAACSSVAMNSFA
jgi:hypothetical protein